MSVRPRIWHQGFFLVVALALLPAPPARKNPSWQTLAPAMELGSVTPRKPSSVGDSRIVVLRMDPNSWELTAIGVSQTGESSGHTAREWCAKHNLVAAINAGMFAGDQKTHLGYLRCHEHVYNGHQNQYQSVAAFAPRIGRSLPRFRIFDLDAPGVTLQSIQQDYDSAVQNLRLINAPARTSGASSRKSGVRLPWARTTRAASCSFLPGRRSPCTI